MIHELYCLEKSADRRVLSLWNPKMQDVSEKKPTSQSALEDRPHPDPL